MKHLIYILTFISLSEIKAQQKVDQSLFEQKSDGLMRYTEIGETYIRKVIADGWFTDTTDNSRKSYHNPYDLYSVSQKQTNDKDGFVFFRYSNGKRCNGLIIDSVFYNKNLVQPYFKGEYHNGLLEGKTEMYFTFADGVSEHGKLKSLGKFEKGEPVGEWINFFPSGEVRDKYEYVKDCKFVQRVTSYFKNGSIEYKTEFSEDGSRKYLNRFYPDGKLLSSKILTQRKKSELFYNYIEYFPNGYIKTNGVIHEDNISSDKIGIWEVYTELGDKTIINYSKNKH